MIRYGVARIALSTPGFVTEYVAADRPSPTIRASLLGGGRNSEIEIGYYEDMDTETTAVATKPAYRVPSMAEVRAIPWNGLNVVSTFSGCGGSCLGYRMAGFRVLWANEFVPAARATYQANHPDSILDPRDIRKVKPADILEAIGLDAGALDVLDGSPPCASFSTAGKRQAGWGKVKAYSDTKQRTDDLFFEYARLLDGLRPRTFVAENVSGLVKGAAKGYFLEILGALKACGYRVAARVLDAQWLGVPQARQRLFFVGVRDDLGLAPVHPRPLAYRYSVRDAIGGVGLRTKSYASNGWTGADDPACAVQASGQYWTEIEAIESRNGQYIGAGNVARTIRASDGSRSSTTLENDTGHVPDVAGVVRKFSIAELRRICAFPDDFALTGTYAQQWERLGRAVPPVMMGHIAATIRDQILCKIPTG